MPATPTVLISANNVRIRFLLLITFILPAFFLLLAPEAFGQASGVANVTFQWTDRVGGVHRMKDTFVSGLEDDSPLGPENAGSGYTSLAGVFPFIALDSGIGQSQTEFYGTVEARIGFAGSEIARVRNSSGNVYQLSWPNNTGGRYLVPDPPGTANFTFTVDNTTYAGSAMQMLQFVDFMHDYYKTTHGATIPSIPIDYHSGTNGSYYCEGDLGTAQCSEQLIQIDSNNWASMEVVMHEYGHHIAYSNNLDGPFGGPHSFGRDNIGSLNGGNNNGVSGARLGWGEGVGTFLAEMAIQDGGLTTAIPGLPGRDSDTNYTAFNTPTTASTQNDTTNLTFNLSFESLAPTTGSAGFDKGEGDEQSVLRVLWDVYDSPSDAYVTGSDTLNFGSQTTYNLLKGNNTFEDFWNDLTTSAKADPTRVGLAAGAKEPQILAALGTTLEEYRVSGDPRPVGAVVNDTTPRLVFDEQNNDNSDVYRYVVYNNDFTTLVDSFTFNENTVGEGAYLYDVATPLNIGETYHWAILSNSFLDSGATPANLDDWYWSSFDTFKVVPEPTSSFLLMLSLTGLFFVPKR